jgi:hypothetical protein
MESLSINETTHEREPLLPIDAAISEPANLRSAGTVRSLDGRHKLCTNSTAEAR